MPQMAGAVAAASVQKQAAGGACEVWPLARADEDNDWRAVSLYIDEIGALRPRPRNPRAEALAAACGLSGISIHGDAYVGRKVRGLAGGEVNDPFKLGELDHESKWVLGARRSHQAQAEALDYKDDAHLASGGNAETDGYTWTQGDDDVEVRVSRGIPEGNPKLAKKRILVGYGKGASLFVRVDGKEVLGVAKLFDRVAPDECSWTLDAGVLVISMEKIERRPWVSLELPELK